MNSSQGVWMINFVCGRFMDSHSIQNCRQFEKNFMKKNRQPEAGKTVNPYEKIFDDANQMLKQMGNFDYLRDLPKDHNKEAASIPFPYGSRKTKPYNC